jgi:hypothetical protein
MSWRANGATLLHVEHHLRRFAPDRTVPARSLGHLTACVLSERTKDTCYSPGS